MSTAGSLEEKMEAAGLATPQEIAQAREMARSQNISLSQALVALNVVGYEEIGRCLSELHGLPYLPLLIRPPGYQARSFLSPQCAMAWKVFPSAYDRESNVLTLAVHDPEQMVRMENLHRLLMQSHAVAFTVASEAEIDKALDVHIGAGKGQPAERVKLAALDRIRTQGPVSAPADRGRQVKPAPQERPSLPADAPPETIAYQDMSGALTSSFALLASLHLGSNPDQLQQLRSNVRYGKLLAARLDFTTIQTDALVLATWLSALEDRRDLVKRLVTSYRLEEVLFPQDLPKGSQRPEARALSLVRCYEQLQRNDPSSSRDINLTRRYLRMSWSFSPRDQEMLETFLQILMDEQFLAELGKTVGRVLIVDATEEVAACLSPPLRSEGYDVEVLPDGAMAMDRIAASPPDVIVADLSHSTEAGLQFCRQIKESPDTDRIAFIAVTATDDHRRTVESLRSGADEVLAKPIDTELLFLKIQRLLASRAWQRRKDGVSGTLQDMPFPDMIQILCAGNKNMEIILTHGAEEGHVFIRGGEIIHAHTAALEGEDAFYALMRWPSGEFRTRQCQDFPRRTIHAAVVSLLMEGARLVDEAADSAAEEGLLKASA